MSEPVLVGLLFADRVITENNGKKGIIGTFNRFFAPKFPIIFPPWSIYAAVTNLIGKHSFSLRLVHCDNEKVVIPIEGQMDVKSQTDVLELTFNVVGATFPVAGDYVLSFSVDNELLASRVLLVTQAEPSGPSESQTNQGNPKN